MALQGLAGAGPGGVGQDPEASGKWRQWPSSAIGPGRQGWVPAGPDGRLVIPSASRARASIVHICIFIHGENPVPKGPSKDWREPFLEGPADTSQRGENGASGHRAGYGLTGKTGVRRPGSPASGSLRPARERESLCIASASRVAYLYLYFVTLSAAGLPCRNDPPTAGRVRSVPRGVGQDVQHGKCGGVSGYLARCGVQALQRGGRI